jgi:tetratricopeptide (TPR) repeat protein
MRRAALALQRGEVEQSITEARQAAELTPSQPVVWALLTEAQVAGLDWPEARQSALRWLELDPQAAGALLMAASVHIELGELAEARLLYDSASMLFPEKAAGPMGQALCAGLSGDWQELERGLKEARRRSPSLKLASLPLQAGWQRLAPDEQFIATLERVLATP